MSGRNFLYNNKIESALDYASGSADREGSVVDTQGFNNVSCIVKFATIAAGAVTTIKMQQGDESDLSDAADLEDTGISVTADDDNQIFALEIVKPLKRYLRLYVDKDASNATAESAVYILSQGRHMPCDNNVADAITSEVHVSPDEGTA